MRNFNNDDRGGWKPKRSFGNRSFGGGRDFGGDRERPEMHSAVCSECGNDCEVPFKPDGRKPVFCRSCFKKDSFEDEGFERREFSRDKRDHFEKPRFDKPAAKEQGSGENYKAQFEMLNFKMDMILKTLHQMGENKAKATPAPVEAPVAAKAEEVKETKEVKAPKAVKAKKKKKE